MSLCPDSVIEPALPGKFSSSFSPATIGAVEVIVALVLISPSIKTPSGGKTLGVATFPSPSWAVAKDVPAPPTPSLIALAATGTPEPPISSRKVLLSSIDANSSATLFVAAVYVAVVGDTLLCSAAVASSISMSW